MGFELHSHGYYPSHPGPGMFPRIGLCQSAGRIAWQPVLAPRQDYTFRVKLQFGANPVCLGISDRGPASSSLAT